MMRKKAKITRNVLTVLLLGLLMFGASLSSGAEGFKVIVNRNVTFAEISKDEVKQIMMKKASRFSDGTGAAPIDLSPNSPVREAFSRDVLGRSASAVSSFWQRQIFSGKEVPPPSVGSDAEVIAHVGSTRGGLGYVSEGARLPDSVVEVKLVN